MKSEVIDKIEVKEQYITSNGNKKTRTHTIRSMVNNGSQFLNYRCGRNSVNINKDMISTLTEKMNEINWQPSEQQKENIETNSVDNELLKAIQQIGKNQQKINSRLDKIEKSE